MFSQLTPRNEGADQNDSTHAGVMLTLGKAASGAAMAGALAPVILDPRAVAASAQIAFATPENHIK